MRLREHFITIRDSRVDRESRKKPLNTELTAEAAVWGVAAL
jgi:hypothetical protein